MQEPTTPSEFHEANRLSWNEATVAQNSHKKDQAGFLRVNAVFGQILLSQTVVTKGDRSRWCPQLNDYTREGRPFPFNTTSFIRPVCTSLLTTSSTWRNDSPRRRFR